jgi:hypothetical protein
MITSLLSLFTTKASEGSPVSILMLSEQSLFRQFKDVGRDGSDSTRMFSIDETFASSLTRNGIETSAFLDDEFFNLGFFDWRGDRDKTFCPAGLVDLTVNPEWFSDFEFSDGGWEFSFSALGGSMKTATSGLEGEEHESIRDREPDELIEHESRRDREPDELIRPLEMLPSSSLRTDSWKTRTGVSEFD